MPNFKMPTITIEGGEDPIIARPYAFIPNGPVYWDKETFEATVSPENRGRFIFPPQRECKPSPAPAVAPTPKPQPVERQRLRPGVYHVFDVDLTVGADGGVSDSWGNWLFYAPETEGELATMWQEFCECGE